MSARRHPGKAGKQRAQLRRPSRSGHALWWRPALIAAVALACYVQATNYSFVHDDEVQIVQNPRIRSFSNLPTAFTENFWAFASATSSTNYYRPLQTLSYMTGYAVGGLNPRVYHWLNILLHALASLVLYWFGWWFTGVCSAGFWAAMLFAAHPIHTESVTWVAGITDVGCGLFYFLCLAAYCRFVRGGQRQSLWLGLSVVSFLAAHLFKEMALTLLPVIYLLDYTVTDKTLFSPARFKRLIPFLSTLALYLVLRVHALGNFSQTTLALPMSLADRLLTMVYFVARYLEDLLLPVRQNAFHVFRPFSRLDVLDGLVPMLILLAGIYFASRCLSRDRGLLFLAVFPAITLIPVLNLTGLGQNVYAERYLYIPSGGFCVLVVILLHRWLARTDVRVALQGSILAVLALLTVLRNPVWKDDRTLYTATLELSPDSVQYRNNLGRLYFTEGNVTAARKEFEAARDAASKAYAIPPVEEATTLVGLSSVAVAEGRMQDAWSYAVAGKDLAPQLAEVYQAMGHVALRRGDTAEAETQLRRALSLQPGSALAHANLGSILLARNRAREAEAELREAVRLDPANAGVLVALANVMAQTGRKPDALLLLRQALELDPSNRQAQELLRIVSSGK